NLNKSSPSPYLVLFVGLLAVSTASIFIRLAQAEAPSVVIAALRLTLAGIMLTPIMLARHRSEVRAFTRQQVGLMALSGVFLAIHFATWITSLEYVSVLVSVVLVTTNPLWVALFAPLLLHERLPRRTLLGILIAMGGGVLISLTPDVSTAAQDNLALGSALSIAGAITVALYMIIGRRLRAKLSLLPYIWLTYCSAAIVLLLMVALTGQSLLGYSALTYFWMLMTALGPQLIGHSSFNYALGHLPAAYVSLVVLAEPLGSTILAMLFLGEMPGLPQIAGAVLILCGVIYGRQNHSAPQQRTPGGVP
ncbi:MAG: DMT family transporter, partial [Anaerolineae bacterium]|nr:DMT family transporter [Anaerolineae bacterium]